MVRSLFPIGLSRTLRRLSCRNVISILVVLFSVYAPAARAQSGDWVWMGGSSTIPPATTCATNQSYYIDGYRCGQTGIYGQPGVASVANIPGGRADMSAWTTADGTLWLFGGDGVDAAGNYGHLNDMWQFDPPTNEWTWVSGDKTAKCVANGSILLCDAPGVAGSQGVAAAGNVPAGRGDGFNWIDPSGNLWLYGGLGTLNVSFSVGDGLSLSDLWKFDPGTAEWTWVNGSTAGNTLPVFGTLGVSSAASSPGGRWAGASWTDPGGNLWLFGGISLTAAEGEDYSNDLWEFNSRTSEWAWMGGDTNGGACRSTSPPSNICSDPGVYGSIGAASASNIPGGRAWPVTWTDSIGNLWMFGGDGYDAAGTMCPLNDLWKYNPGTREWTWMGGDNICYASNSVGSYGSIGVANSGNYPGIRLSAAATVDFSGNFWMFGGLGSGATGGCCGFLDDVWEYSSTSNEWTWTGGSDSINQVGSYGLLGISAAGNLPPGRNSSAGWLDRNGDFWFFGGFEGDTQASTGYLNDMWKFIPATSSETATPTFAPGSGTYTSPQNVTISDTTPNATIYYAINAMPTTASTQYTGPITVSSSETIEAIAVATGYSPSAVASAAYTINGPAVTPTFNPPSGTYTSAQSVTISDTTPNATIYYAINATPTTSSTQYTGSITVSSSETIEAIAVANGYSDSPVASATYIISLPAAAPTFNPPAGTYTSAQSVTISDTTPNATIYYAINATPTTSSTQYTGPIAVSTSETIEAIAVANGYSTSATGTAAYTINLPQSGFTFDASPQSLTVNRGGQSAVTLTVTPQNGFNGQVGFSCSGLPSGASCSFQPATVTPSGSPVTAQLMFGAGATSAQATHQRGATRTPVLALAALLGFIGWRKRRGMRLLAMLVAAVAIFSLAGCHPVFLFHSTPVTYEVTVTATSGTLQQSATIELTVQ